MLGQSYSDAKARGPGLERPPSDGIWYVLRYPAGWELEFVREADYTEVSAGEHVDWWKSELADKLATAWAPKLKTNFSYVKKVLLDSPHGFPRGRIELNPVTVFWGDNLTMKMGLVRSRLLEAFELKMATTRWQVSKWEMVNEEDKQALRFLLALEEDWPAQPLSK